MWASDSRLDEINAGDAPSARERRFLKKVPGLPEWRRKSDAMVDFAKDRKRRQKIAKMSRKKNR